MDKLESLAWLLALPAAAECVASVWIPEMSLLGADVKLVFLNATGALLEGVFSAWEGGRAPAPPGAVGAALVSLSGAMRGGFIAAYTSWGGMVAVAAGGSAAAGLGYLGATFVLGSLAHAAGGALALALGAPASATDASTKDAARVRGALLAAVLALVGASVMAVEEGMDYDDDFYGYKDEDVELPALIKALDAEYARLGIGMACAVAGAAVGNAVGAAVERAFGGGEAVAIPTLCCNGAFCLASLVLPLATLRRRRWGRSVLLQSFAGSFCGAATAFGGWVDDSAARWRDGGAAAALANVGANLAIAALLVALFMAADALQANAAAIDANGNRVTEAAELLAFVSARANWWRAA